MRQGQRNDGYLEAADVLRFGTSTATGQQVPYFKSDGVW